LSAPYPSSQSLSRHPGWWLARLAVALAAAALVVSAAFLAWHVYSALGRYLPTLHAGVQLAMAAPELLGADGPRTYLILAQNEDELRPTGGFISATGLVTFDRGRITQLTFRDSYAVDDLSKPYPEPPWPLRDYMLADLWLFRDINWSPDFPTTARQAAEVYEYGRGVRVDGVIAVDQAALRYLLEGLGSVTIEATGETVSAANVIEAIRAHWQPAPGQGLTGEWWRQRKSFLGDLAAAIRRKVESGPAALDMPGLAWAIKRALDEKHILVYLLSHAEAQSTQRVSHISQAGAVEALRRLGWDGAVHQESGDYLMVVDANVGFNKASALVTKQIDYQVVLQADGSAGALATVTYRHGGARQGERCRPEIRYDPVYVQMMERCLWDYVRLYVPGGATLKQGPAIVVPAEQMLSGRATGGTVDVESAEEGKVSFGLLFVLAPGEMTSLQYAYDLPVGLVGRIDSVDEWRYDLLVQRQPGTDGAPVQVTVTLPEGASLIASEPAPAAVSGSQVKYRFDLVQDRSVSLRYQAVGVGSVGAGLAPAGE
jgi:hypothetical protein